jgi:hypothetical protein
VRVLVADRSASNAELLDPIRLLIEVAALIRDPISGTKALAHTVVCESPTSRLAIWPSPVFAFPQVLCSSSLLCAVVSPKRHSSKYSVFRESFFWVARCFGVVEVWTQIRAPQSVVTHRLITNIPLSQLDGRSTRRPQACFSFTDSSCSHTQLFRDRRLRTRYPHHDERQGRRTR